jgi:hypothetical protein
MIDVSYTVEGGFLQRHLLIQAAAGNLPNTAEAVRKGVADTWSQYVQNVSAGGGAALEYNGRSFVIYSVTGTYAGGIRGVYPFMGNPLAGIVAPFGVAYAGAIEKGFERFDMKPGLYASPRAKVSRKGYRYILIPIRRFRRGAFGLDPKEGEFTNPNYSWWNKKTAEEVFGSVGEARKHGVVRTSAKKSHSQWAQFICVSERTKPVGSAGWWHPGMPPRPVAHATAKQMGPHIQRLIAAGFREDVRRLTKGSPR